MKPSAPTDSWYVPDSQSYCLVVVDPPHPGLVSASCASFADSSPLVWLREVEVGSPQTTLLGGPYWREVYGVTARRERYSCASRERHCNGAVRDRIWYKWSWKGRAVLDKEASSSNENSEEASHLVVMVWRTNGVDGLCEFVLLMVLCRGAMKCWA